MEYLPPLYHDVREFAEIMNTEEVELDELKAAIDQQLDDQFIMTASERSIKRRERGLGIVADPTKESLEFRRQRLTNRNATKPPFTIRFLQNRLDFLVGPGRAVVSYTPNDFLLKITTKIEDASVFREVEHTVDAIIPQNLVYQQDTAINEQIGLEEHITTQTLTRDMRLSTTWRLGVTPFATAGPEVIVK